jgi:hypothetical protein
MAEPIAITVLRRKEDTMVGVVRNIRFSNILCESENGILIYGERPGLIENIRFDGVSVHLRKATDYEKGRHDLRPTVGPLSTESGLAHIHAHNAAKVTFRDCEWTSDLPSTLCIKENCSDFHLEEDMPC